MDGGADTSRRCNEGWAHPWRSRSDSRLGGARLFARSEVGRPIRGAPIEPGWTSRHLLRAKSRRGRRSAGARTFRDARWKGWQLERERSPKLGEVGKATFHVKQAPWKRPRSGPEAVESHDWTPPEQSPSGPAGDGWLVGSWPPRHRAALGPTVQRPKERRSSAPRLDRGQHRSRGRLSSAWDDIERSRIDLWSSDMRPGVKGDGRLAGPVSTESGPENLRD